MNDFDITFYGADGHIDETATDEFHALLRIDTAIRNMKAQEQIIYDATYLRDLAKADYVRQVQSLKSSYDDRDNTFSNAQNYLTKNDEQYAAYFEMLQDDFRVDFFNRDNRFELVSIKSVGLSSYAWFVQFRFGDKRLAIQIPRRDNLTVENIDRADGGKFQFAVETSKNNWKFITSDYFEKPIAEAIKKHFELD